jgi:hypothetical protein
MPESRSTADDSFLRVKVLEGTMIRVVTTTVTASGLPSDRTVPTSHLSGDLNLRYVPRTPKSSGESDTAS